MQPIQKPDRPKIQIELLMMQIMRFRQALEKVIATMHGRRFEQFVRQKHPEHQDMRAQDLARQGDREDVGEEVFDGVGVLSGERDRRGEFVVLFVDAFVEGGDMQEAVAVVEEDLAEEEAEDDVDDDFGESWKGRGDLVG